VAKTAAVTKDFTLPVLTSHFVQPWQRQQNWHRLRFPYFCSQLEAAKARSQITSAMSPLPTATEGRKVAGKAQQISMPPLQQDLACPLHFDRSDPLLFWFSHLVLQHTLPQWAWYSDQPDHPRFEAALFLTLKQCQEALPLRSPR